MVSSPRNSGGQGQRVARGRGRSGLCKTEGCTRYAIFGTPGGRAIACSAHRARDMQNFKKRRQCAISSCPKRPSFNFSDSSVPLYCAEHRQPLMVNVCSSSSRRYALLERDLLGSTGIPPSEGGRSSAAVSPPPPPSPKAEESSGAVAAASSHCKNSWACREKDCTRHAMYGFEGEKPTRCSLHKTEGMKDVKKRRLCESEGCHKRASFAYLSQPKASRCAQHKLSGMINLNMKPVCEFPLCTQRVKRRFFLPGNGDELENARFCEWHWSTCLSSMDSGLEGCEFLGEPVATDWALPAFGAPLLDTGVQSNSCLLDELLWPGNQPGGGCEDAAPLTDFSAWASEGCVIPCGMPPVFGDLLVM